MAGEAFRESMPPRTEALRSKRCVNT